MEISELAAYAREFFEQKTRDDDQRFWTLKRRHPTWVEDLVHEAHGDMMPEDYKYAFVLDTLDALEEGRDPEEPELEPDIYTHDLNRWLASNLTRAGYVDEAVEDYGHSDQGITGDIGLGQLREKEEVWGIVIQELQKRLEAIEMDEPEIFERPKSKTKPKKGVKDWSPRDR